MSKPVVPEHYHCPFDCSHPQPFVLYDDETMVCAHCYYVHHLISFVLPCTEDICGEAEH